MKLKIIFILIILISFAHAHEGEVYEDEFQQEFGPAVKGVNTWESVSPFSQIAQGNLGYGIFLIFLWIATIWGVISLLYLVLGRLLISKK